MGINLRRQSSGTKRENRCFDGNIRTHATHCKGISTPLVQSSIHSFVYKSRTYFLSICAQCKCQEIAHYLFANACHRSINLKTAAPPPVISSTDRSSLKSSESSKTVCTGNCTFYNFLWTPLTANIWIHDVSCRAGVGLKQCGRSYAGDRKLQVHELHQIRASWRS